MLEDIKQGKTAAIIGYILFIGPLIALSMNSDPKSKFASFHIRQGIGLTLLFISLGLIISNFHNDMILISMWIFVSILCVYGLITAANGETKTLPIIGNFFQKVFKNI
jgi:uncharacterized membrane protein